MNQANLDNAFSPLVKKHTAWDNHKLTGQMGDMWLNMIDCNSCGTNKFSPWCHHGFNVRECPYCFEHSPKKISPKKRSPKKRSPKRQHSRKNSVCAHGHYKHLCSWCGNKYQFHHNDLWNNGYHGYHGYDISKEPQKL